MSKDYGVFSCEKITSSDKNDIALHRNPNKPTPMISGESFHLIYGRSHEEIYQFWALIIAVISLGIIALQIIGQMIAQFI